MSALAIGNGFVRAPAGLDSFANIHPSRTSCLPNYFMLLNTLALAASLLVSDVPASKSASAPGRELDRALKTIEVKEISADIHFLACDELGGRDSPSNGQRIAARYIRSRLVRLGLEPGASDGYFYNYSLAQYGLNEDETFMSVTRGGKTARMKFGEDYYVSMGSRGARSAGGPVVYVGDFEDDDLEDVDLKGAWGLLDPGARVSRKRNQAANEEGMLGLIIPFDSTSSKSSEEMYGRWLSAARRKSSGEQRTYGVPLLYLAEERGADWVGNQEPEFGASLGFEMTESYASGPLDGIALENVCGLWPGSDRKLRNDVIIISAHYDHVGQRDNGDIYNGADDNASGTTGLLAIAEALTEYGPMKRTVLLMWVSAEEKGLLGSRAWTLDPWLPEGMKPFCNLNIDMIGRNAPDEIGVTPTASHPEYNQLTKMVEEHCGKEGFTKLNNADAYWSRSDHANFARNLKIPVAFLFSDVHEDYHKPTDTPDKIDCDKLSRVARLVVRLLDSLQSPNLELRIGN